MCLRLVCCGEIAIIATNLSRLNIAKTAMGLPAGDSVVLFGLLYGRYRCDLNALELRGFQMAITACPSCGKDVSPKAFDCPHCGHPLRKPKRGMFGKLAKWLLILFNALMIIWLIAYLGEVGDVVENSASDAEQAGAAIGGTIGTGMILVVWVIGDIILGLWALLTRPSK